MTNNASSVVLAAEVGELLRARGETLALAESCTGGLIAAAITEVPGSSDYLWGGAVVYSVAAKTTLAGIDAELVRKHGAVSAETTAALAEAVRRKAMTSYGLAVTGWAGPTVDRSESVGLVFVAVVDGRGTTTARYQFGGDRATVRSQACVAALEQLRARLSPAQDRADSDAEGS